MKLATVFLTYNPASETKILVCAATRQEAETLAENYKSCRGMAGEFELEKLYGKIDGIDDEYMHRISPKPSVHRSG